MAHSTRTALVTTTLLGLTMALLAACGDAEIAKGEIEKTAQEQLTKSVGKEAPPVTCPGNLKATVGSTLTCSMDIDGKIHDVNVKVTSVEGSTAQFDIEVADKPRG